MYDIHLECIKLHVHRKVTLKCFTDYSSFSYCTYSLSTLLSYPNHNYVQISYKPSPHLIFSICSPTKYQALNLMDAGAGLFQPNGCETQYHQCKFFPLKIQETSKTSAAEFCPAIQFDANFAKTILA